MQLLADLFLTDFITKAAHLTVTDDYHSVAKFQIQATAVKN